MICCASKTVTITAVRNATDLSETEFRFFYNLATLQRRKRTDAFLRREDACRSLIGEALIRLTVWTNTGKALDATMFDVNEFGRPFIKDIPFFYNIAHSGSWVVCAADRDEIGVDVEKKQVIDLCIADRFFSPGEAKLIRDCATEDEQRTMFFSLWVCKESYIKALGRGLSCPLNSFECLPDITGRYTELHVLDKTLPHRYFRFIQLSDNEYACAVCTMHPGIFPQVAIWSPSELIQQLSPL
jgi:4'-phosphopantetheinyl transferase